MEAMSLSLPVIGIDNGGLSEVLDEKCSILIKPTSSEDVVDSLVSSITKLAKDHDLRKSMGAAGKKRVKDEFSWKTIGQELEEIYDKALNKASKSKVSNCSNSGSTAKVGV